MAPPVRERDDAEDEAIGAGDAEGNAKPPRGSTTPVKAPRLEKSATAPPMRGAPTASTLRAFASREDDLMNTPGSTSGLTSSGERTPASTSTENEIGSECNVDQHLTSHDRELQELRHSQDTEELDMMAADERRRARDESEGETDAETHGWNANFKLAVHEAGRRWFARSFQRGRPFDECMKMCFSRDDERVHAILSEFGASASELNVSYKHVMGEALELLVCYLSEIQPRVEMRDYLAEAQYGANHETRPPVFVECEVYKCFMSGVPVGSPWRMMQKDYKHLVEIFGGCEEAKKLADTLHSQSQYDRFFDVLLILKDLNNEGRFHIQAVQCKARTRFEAYINISQYIGYQSAIADMAEKLNCLVRLDWVTNTYDCKQAEAGDDFAGHRQIGKLNIFCFKEFFENAENIYDAATMAAHPFGSRESEIVPERPRPVPRECQRRALEKLKAAREESRLKSVSIVCATGIGKSLIACMDATSALYDDETGDPLTKVDQIGMVWCSPRILLVEQSAESFSSWEESELREIAKRRGGKRVPIPFYYVVCSQMGDMEKPRANKIRRINNGQLCDTFLSHAKRGELSRCRFFTTKEGGSVFWHQVVKYIRLSRGIDAPLSEEGNELFHVGIVDEAHELAGNSAGLYQLCYNIPCQWRVSYSATPRIEKQRAAFIMEHLKEESPSEEDGDSDGDGAFEDAAEVPDRPEKRFPHEYFKSLHEIGISSRDDDDDPVIDKYVTQIGLTKIQLLSRSLQLVPLDVAARSAYFSDKRELLASLDSVASSCQKIEGPSADDVELALGGQIVLFKAFKEKYRGRCSCRRRKASDVDDVQQCDPHCASKVFPAEVPSHERYQCNFDYGVGNFVVMDQSQTDQALQPECIVLGWENNSRTLSIRDGPPRGMGCHDFSGFGVQSGKNLIGNPVYTYTFAEAFRFQSSNGNRILARPCLVTYKLKAPDEGQLNQLERERLVNKIFGVDKKVTKAGKETYTAKELKKIGLRINFPPCNTPIAVTTHDYATVATIYRMIERKQARKIIVFVSPNNNVCRRVFALFIQFLRKRIEQAHTCGNHDLAQLLRRVHATHYWSTWDNPDGTARPPLETRVKEKMLHDFRMGDIEVLFNVNVLSTGLDLPCTDAVVLTTATESVELILQRWGRALRSIPGQQDKRGILAIVTLDPRESDEDKGRRRDFFGLNSEFAGDIGGTKTQTQGFRKMYETGEAAVHESNRILGNTFEIQSNKVKAKKAKADTPRKAPGSVPEKSATVHPNLEDVLCGMFDIELRDLLADP